MYILKKSQRFKKDFKKILKRNSFKEQLFTSVLQSLVKGKKLEEKYKDHQLKGEFSGCRECHIQPDILLIYETDQINKIIYLLRTGSHSDLF